MYFSSEEYADRWRRVSVLMDKQGYDCLVVWQRGAGGYDRVGNVYWLTNFVPCGTGQDLPDEVNSGGYSFAAVVFRGEREPELHIAQPLKDFDSSSVVCGELMSHPNLMTGLAEYLGTQGIEGKVALVGDDVLPAMYDRMLRRHTPQIEWVAEEDFLYEAQAVKSPRELEAFRTAGDIATRSLTAMMEALIAGQTEAEAAARAAAIVLRAGGAFHKISINHGQKSERYLSSNDFHGFSTTAAAPGDFVRGWVYGPIFQGYWLDPGRTAICGNRPTVQQKAVLEGAASIVDNVVAAIAPGVTPRALGVIADKIAREVGFYDQPQLAVPFGHGLGTFFVPHVIPSDPQMADPSGKANLDVPLRSGMIIAVEAFLTHSGVGTAGFEQNLIVNDGGTELLTRTPMHFW
jgi:Xaa-Pro dipeptidase